MPRRARLALALATLLWSGSTAAAADVPIFAHEAPVVADGGAYRFFAIGHAYGAHTRRAKRYGHSPLPAASLLANLERLRTYDFGVFLGDVFEACGPESLGQFKSLVADRLGLPLFNAKGNHDNCAEYNRVHEHDIAFEVNADLFLIYSALDRARIQDLTTRLRQRLAGTAPVRVFVFTHRPWWTTLDPDLALAGRRANSKIRPSNALGHALAPLLELMARRDRGDRLVWFAGDVAWTNSYPLLFHRLGCCLRLIATGLYDNAMDNFVEVAVTDDKVELNARSLTGVPLQPLDHYDVDWLAGFLAVK